MADLPSSLNTDADWGKLIAWMRERGFGVCVLRSGVKVVPGWSKR